MISHLSIPKNSIKVVVEEQFYATHLPEKVENAFDEYVKLLKMQGKICIYEGIHPALGREVHLVSPSVF